MKESACAGAYSSRHLALVYHRYEFMKCLLNICTEQVLVPGKCAVVVVDDLDALSFQDGGSRGATGLAAMPCLGSV
jgi:hypothetical protein